MENKKTPTTWSVFFYYSKISYPLNHFLTSEHFFHMKKYVLKEKGPHGKGRSLSGGSIVDLICDVALGKQKFT